jgi:hypothetical protein
MAETPLSQSLNLFRAFDEAGIVYCHFKSNEHLVEGLAGLTDLDVLVEQGRTEDIQRALVSVGFKRFASQLASAYPGVEDYLGFDVESSRLIHLHLHYVLAAGEPHLKSFQLLLGDDLLATRVVDEETGVSISDPNLEMQLLMVRCALKLRWRDQILQLLGRPYLRGGLMREFHWLMERIDRERVLESAQATLGWRAAAALSRLLVDSPTLGDLRRLRSSATAALAYERTYGRATACLVRLAREATWWFSAINRRLLRLPIPARRTIPSGGLIIAFLGPDGSGKSTVTEELRTWLGWKIDVYPAYFGSGDGSVSALRWPLKLALGVYRRLRPAAADVSLTGGNPVEGGEDASEETPRKDRGIAKLRWIWALVLAVEKRSKMRSVVRARNRGMAVICDRYPQIQVLGFNDGPLLASWLEGPAGLRRRLARWEFDVYQAAARNAPDLAIKLKVTPEVAHRRKPEATVAEVSRRLEALEKIDFGERCEHVEVDVDQPLEGVLAAVKQAVWKRL